MSVKIMGLVWDLNNDEIDREEKYILLAYSDHADHKGFNIFPAISTIAEKTGYKERAVQMITRSLQVKGFLVADGKGSHGTNKWRVPLDEEGARIAPVKNAGMQKEANGGAKSKVQGVQQNAPEPSLTIKESKEAAKPLSSEDIKEIKSSAKKFVDGYLENERVIQEKNQAGQAWRGRELCPPNYLVYGDWWHSKTQQHMYGAKGKQKINTEWLKAFKEFYEHDIPLSVLDETYEAEIAWKKIISKPSELVTKAIAIASLPPISEAKPMDTESYNQRVFNKIKQSLGVTA